MHTEGILKSSAELAMKPNSKHENEHKIYTNYWEKTAKLGKKL